MAGKGVPEIDRMAVKITHLDQLLSLTGEIIITASNMSILQRHLQSQTKVLDKDSTEMVKNATLTANRISSDLHHLVMDIRLIPIKDTFLRFRRLVRDLAKRKGRQVNFEIVGEDTLVDKTVAERIYEPLAHQIRNAIDHGLEDPLERKQKGKDPKGQLTLKAYKKEEFTYISVADDGRGLDENRIKKAAVEKDLLSPGAAAGMHTQDAYQLIMQPGFSTTSEATEISGRGVGMDVVKNTIEELGGEIIIESETDGGSVFTYKIPQLSAVNITDALIIRAGDVFFAVPIGHVVATQAFQAEDLHKTMEAGECIIYLGSIIPVHDLSELLSDAGLDDVDGAIPVIIIEAKNGRVALKVSEFIRPQKLVLIPLPEIFNVKGVSGTTILGGSQLGLVLDPFELIGLATGKIQESMEDGFLSREIVAFDDNGSFEEGPTVESASQVDGDAAGEQAQDSMGAVAGVDDHLVQEFFLEIQNILTELNEDIFQLEKDPENLKRVNTIFRHFHSIKGNLIMTGFTDLGGFVHKVETVLDRVRDKELAVNQEIIDLFLDAVKSLEEALVKLRAGQPYQISDQELLTILEKYRRLETPRVAEEEVIDEAFHLSSLGQLLLHAKVTQGTNIFQAILKYKPKFQEPFLVAYLILKRMALVGEILDTVPSLEKIEKGLVTDSIKVLFATIHSQEEVDRFIEGQLVKHYDVFEFENLLME